MMKISSIYLHHVWGCHRGVGESVSFEYTKKKVSKRRSYFSAHNSTMDLTIMQFVKREIIYGEDHTKEIT